jgi:hypothetical protein
MYAVAVIGTLLAVWIIVLWGSASFSRNMH